MMDVQEDNLLAQRVNEVRLLKEKVQLAYFDLSKKDSTKKVLSCPALFSITTSLVAGVMILLATELLLFSTMPGSDEIFLAKQLIMHTDSIAPEAISVTIGASKQIVIDIS